MKKDVSEALDLLSNIDICDPVDDEYFRNYQKKVDEAIETIRQTLQNSIAKQAVFEGLEGMKKFVPEHYDDNHRQQILRRKGYNRALQDAIDLIKGEE